MSGSSADLTDSMNSKIIVFAFALAAEIEQNLISQRMKEALVLKKMEGVRLGVLRDAHRRRLHFVRSMLIS